MVNSIITFINFSWSVEIHLSWTKIFVLHFEVLLIHKLKMTCVMLCMCTHRTDILHCQHIETYLWFVFYAVPINRYAELLFHRIFTNWWRRQENKLFKKIPLGGTQISGCLSEFKKCYSVTSHLLCTFWSSKQTAAIFKIHLNVIKQSFQNTFKYSNTISPDLPLHC